MNLDPWKEYLAKYFTNLVSVLTLVGGVWLGYDYYQNKEHAKKERALLEERYGKLIGTIEDSQILGYATQLATAYKEQAALAKEAKEVWKELAKERGERIKSISEAVISVDSSTESQDSSDYVFKIPNSDKGYILNELRIDGKESPPIGYVLIKDDGRVYKKNYSFEIRIESVQLKDDLTGKVRVITRAFLVPKENGLAGKRRPDLKKWKDEKYPLVVSGGEVLLDPIEPLLPEIREKGFIYFPMNINVGFGLFSEPSGETSSKFYMDTNLMGYGFSKRDLDWKLIHVGANYNDLAGIGFHIIPFSYRLLPNLLTNSYLGPGYFFDGLGDGYLLGVNLGL